MKVGLLMAGISYGYKSDRDFRHCFPNIYRNLIEPLKQEHEVITFIATYEHDYIKELINSYQPAATLLIPYENATQVSTRTKCIELTDQDLEYTDSYSKNLDFYIMTRFDVHFNMPLSEFNLNFDKFNFSSREGNNFWESSNYVNDTFYAWPSTLHEEVQKTYKDINNLGYDFLHMHYFYSVLKNHVAEEDIHFMFDTYQLSGHELTSICTEDYVHRLNGRIHINVEVLERFS